MLNSQVVLFVNILDNNDLHSYYLADKTPVKLFLEYFL